MNIKSFSRLTSGRKVIDRFRSMWEAALDDLQKNKLKMMLDAGQFVFFFRYKKEIYGAPEGSRVMFAKMLDPEDEDNSGPGWLKEANFMATNLVKLGQGQAQQMVFGEKELKEIEVLNRDEAYSALEEFFEKEKGK